MVKVQEKKVDWIGTLKEIFGSVSKKDNNDEYLKWEQENKKIIKSSDSNIMKLITQTDSSRGTKKIGKSKPIAKKVKTINQGNQNTDRVSNINKKQTEIEKE